MDFFFLAWAMYNMPLCVTPTITMLDPRPEVTWLTETSAHLHVVHTAYVDYGSERDIYEAIETRYATGGYVSDTPVWTYRIDGSQAHNVPSLWAMPTYPPAWCSLQSVDGYGTLR
jgi:hypothetical protein